MALEQILRNALEELDVVAKDHEEIFDSEVREIIGVAVMDGFVRGKGTNVVPTNVGLPSDESNLRVRSILVKFIQDANSFAESIGLTSFHNRLDAFQNRQVVTDGGNDYEEYFGHTPPEFYDKLGNVTRTQ
jgi:hypothetical protein